MSDGTGRRVRLAEILVVVLLGAAVLAYFQLPHVWAARADRLGHYPGWVYFGGVHTYVDEAATYLAWMRQARDGHLFFTDLYTPEQHPRNFVNLLHWLLGTVGRFTGISLVDVYSAARVAFGALLLWLLYALSRRLFALPGQRIACFFTMLLAGGWEGAAGFMERNFGWSHVSSPSWWMPEISTTFSMMLFPQFLAGFCAMIGSAILMIRAWEPETGSTRSGVWAACGSGGLLFLLTFFHPYDVVPMVGVLGLAPLLFAVAERRIPWRAIGLSLLALLVWLPAFLYNLAIFTTNPAMRWWDLQNIMTTPEVHKVILCLGVGLPLALLGIVAAFRAGRRHLVMAAWLLSTMAIIYLPIRFQRRCMGGMQYPMAALAVAGVAFILVPLLQRLFRRRTDHFLGFGTLAIVMLLSPLQVLTPFFLQEIEWSRLRKVDYPAWIREEVAAAMGALEKNAPQGSVVFASYPMGNIVPPLTGLRCFLGHYALTMDAKGKESAVERFFSAGPDDDPWRLELMERFGVDYLLDSPSERRLGAFDPATRPWLERIYSTGDGTEERVTVYALRLPTGSLPGR